MCYSQQKKKIYKAWYEIWDLRPDGFWMNHWTSPIGQHYEIAMSTQCYMSAPILIWPQMLLWRKTPTKNNNLPNTSQPWLGDLYLINDNTKSRYFSRQSDMRFYHIRQSDLLRHGEITCVLSSSLSCLGLTTQNAFLASTRRHFHLLICHFLHAVPLISLLTHTAPATSYMHGLQFLVLMEFTA